MSLEFGAPPVRDDIAIEDPQTGKLLLPRVWVDWMTALTIRLDSNATALNTVELTAQQASIGTTTIPLDILSAGLYRITYYARITVPGTTSSSLTVTLGWTDHSVSCSTSGAALTGNTVSTVQGGTIMVRNDSASPLTYATTYASVGATAMQYSLDLLVEQIT